MPCPPPPWAVGTPTSAVDGMDAVLAVMNVTRRNSLRPHTPSDVPLLELRLYQTPPCRPLGSGGVAPQYRHPLARALRSLAGLTPQRSHPPHLVLPWPVLWGQQRPCLQRCAPSPSLYVLPRCAAAAPQDRPLCQGAFPPDAPPRRRHRLLCRRRCRLSRLSRCHRECRRRGRLQAGARSGSEEGRLHPACGPRVDDLWTAYKQMTWTGRPVRPNR